MKEFFMLIVVIIVMCVLWSLPVYIATNLVAWVFHLSYHMTILQAFTVSFLLTLLHTLLEWFRGDK